MSMLDHSLSLSRWLTLACGPTRIRSSTLMLISSLLSTSQMWLILHGSSAPKYLYHLKPCLWIHPSSYQASSCILRSPLRAQPPHSTTNTLLGDRFRRSFMPSSASTWQSSTSISPKLMLVSLGMISSTATMVISSQLVLMTEPSLMTLEWPVLRLSMLSCLVAELMPAASRQVFVIGLRPLRWMFLTMSRQLMLQGSKMNM